MAKQYDVIIIGAGNAGLMAAAMSAKAGLSVLLLEKNDTPGGSAASFRRGRFEFEVSLHELAAYGTPENPGSARKAFEALGIDVGMIRIPDAFRVITGGEDGFDLTLPAELNAFIAETEKAVPGSLPSFERLSACIDNANKALKYLGRGKIDPEVMLRDYPDFMRMASCSVKECLDALGMPEKAQQIFCTYWPYQGTRPSDLDMLLYINMLQYYLICPPVFPRLRSLGLSRALEAKVLEYGGEVRYRSRVSEILIDDGTAVGVRVNKEEIRGRRILSTCFPDTVFNGMIAPEDVPERSRRIVNAREIGKLFFCVYLGLNKTKDELGIHDYSTFIFDSPDPEKQADSIRDPMHSFIIGNCLNVLMEEASPEGTSIVYLTTMLSEEAWGDVCEKDYKACKNRIAERMIRQYEEALGVTVRPYIEEIAIATPATFARYLGTPNGTPYGYQLSLWDTLMPRTLNVKNEQHIRNLEFIGAQGERGDGYSSAYSSGRQAAKAVARELKAEKREREGGGA